MQFVHAVQNVNVCFERLALYCFRTVNEVDGCWIRQFLRRPKAIVTVTHQLARQPDQLLLHCFQDMLNFSKSTGAVLMPVGPTNLFKKPEAAFCPNVYVLDGHFFDLHVVDPEIVIFLEQDHIDCDVLDLLPSSSAFFLVDTQVKRRLSFCF